MLVLLKSCGNQPYSKNIGYFLVLNTLLYSKATQTIITEPRRTGVIKKDHELAVVMTTMGLVPAGGCVVF